MSDITDWIQSYWFELGSLTAQFAILAVLVWYARTTLRILTGSERQAEPARKPFEAAPSFVPAEPQPAGHAGVGRMLSPMPAPSVLQSQPATCRVVAERIGPWHAMVKWLQAPMSSRSAVPWRRVTRQIS
jgi:hypothetical protein